MLAVEAEGPRAVAPRDGTCRWARWPTSRRLPRFSSQHYQPPSTVHTDLLLSESMCPCCYSNACECTQSLVHRSQAVRGRNGILFSPMGFTALSSSFVDRCSWIKSKSSRHSSRTTAHFAMSPLRSERVGDESAQEACSRYKGS
jgi:hypothetical protein